MDAFKNGKLRILLTTDLLSRGLDIENMIYVINYSLPEDADIYLHRSGRVGRNGDIGVSVSFIEPREYENIKRRGYEKGLEKTERRRGKS